MSSTTATFGNVPAAADKQVKASPEHRTFYQRFIEARLREAKAQVAGALSRMPDTELAELGFDADRIREIRATEPTFPRL